MEYDIDKIIRLYYSIYIKNNFKYINFCDENELHIIISYFHKEINFKIYDKLLEKIINKNVTKLNKVETENKINKLLKINVFRTIDKSKFIIPNNVLSTDSISINILHSFLRKIIYNILLELIFQMYSNIKFYKRVFENEIFYSCFLELKSILSYYQNAFLQFYIGLINKYDNTGDYIFPVFDRSESNIYLSKLAYNVAGAEDLSKLKDQINNLYQTNIKQVYDKEEIKQLESLLENKKINKLIAKKELKLAPGFNNIIKHMLDKDIKDEDKKKYFDEIFELKDNKNMTKEELYEIYKNEPDKEKFIKYLVDKTMYQNLNNDSTGKVVSLVDNIFNKILKEDYDHNSLNLQDDDIKFILMLETLNSIKTSSIGNSSNITVNLYKDVEKAKINKEEVSFN